MKRSLVEFWADQITSIPLGAAITRPMLSSKRKIFSNNPEPRLHIQTNLGSFVQVDIKPSPLEMMMTFVMRAGWGSTLSWGLAFRTRTMESAEPVAINHIRPLR